MVKRVKKSCASPVTHMDEKVLDSWTPPYVEAEKLIARLTEIVEVEMVGGMICFLTSRRQSLGLDAVRRRN